MNYEEIVIKIIVSGGDARSHAMKAIFKAKEGEIEGAREELGKASESLEIAHDIQTQLIQDEAAGNGKDITLLMVHAQDHLMNAMTVRDMAREFVDMYDKFSTH